MTLAVRRCALASLLIVGSACTNQIWLSDAIDASADAGTRDATPQLDAPREDAGFSDASEAPLDSGPPPPRDCELAPVTIALANIAAPLEQPTLAASGRRESLRLGLLLPPSSSITATDDTRLIVTDGAGAVLRERSIRIESSAGAPASTATLHALSPAAPEAGFLMLAPRAIWLLDGDGEGEPGATLTTPPSSTWQRTAGWLDADRFAFVSDTADLRIAVLDRRTGAVATTPISATDAAIVHIEPGGITISSVGPLSETVVYDPDLSGTEILRTTWDDGALLRDRLIGVAVSGGERTWVVRPANEFRAMVKSYRVTPGELPVERATSGLLIGPLAASREGNLITMVTEAFELTLYSLETQEFTTVPTVFGGPLIIEHERDGSSLSILALESDGEGRLSLDLTCGLD